MRLRNTVSVVHINGNVRLRAAKVDRHAHRAFGVSDALNLMRDLAFPPDKFLLELCDGSIAVLMVELVECPASHRGDTRGKQPDQKHEGQDKYDEHFGPKSHESFPFILYISLAKGLSS